jgi:hypothetical protein
MPKFTEKDIACFHSYEEVRSVGRYNMFDSNARRLTGLSHDDYMFVMVNYTSLKMAAEKAKA